MNRTFWTGIVMAAGLAGCDLQEAERMDLGRAGVAGVESSFGGVLYDGASTVPLTGLVQGLKSGSLAKQWSLAWEDEGTQAHPVLEIRGWAGDLRVFDCFRIGTTTDAYCLVLEDPLVLAERSSQLRFEILDALESPTGLDPRLRVLDDRPRLEWDAALDNPSDVHKGDTIELAFRNPGSDSLEVFDEHAGLRALDDYVVLLAPGASGRMRWVVTASAGEEVRVDLQWGDWGGSHRFTYRNR